MNYNLSANRLALLIFGILIILPLLYSCTRSANPDIQRGSTYDYRPGYPEVRFSSVGFLDESNTPQITIAADIVYGSLVFKENNDGQQEANISLTVQIVNQENAENVVESVNKDVRIARDDASITTSQKSYIFQDRVQVAPGRYKVYFTVTDQASGKKITREGNTNIPNPDGDTIDLTDIRMLGKDMDLEDPQWLPVTTYSVQNSVDSLMFIFQATNNDSEQPLSINANLIQFESDTSVARPMFYNNYSPSSIAYQGIEYDEETIVQQSQRRLLQKGSVFIEFRFAQQDRGNYRFAVRSNKQDGDELFKARDFGVKSKNYPALQTAEELAGPMAYLMGDKEYDKLMAINDADSLKQAIDRFWLKEIGDINKARNVLKLYYQRAEEANKQFSNYKEGWKTDTGMMYILFGPPWYVDRRLDQMQWSYSYNRSDPARNFRFFQPRLESEFYPFKHYLLRRTQQYYNAEYQQRQLWLSGLILQRQI